MVGGRANWEACRDREFRYVRSLTKRRLEILVVGSVLSLAVGEAGCGQLQVAWYLRFKCAVKTRP